MDSSGFVLRESSEEDSTASSSSSSSSLVDDDDGGSEASWQETASRDVSLLDTIGESGDEGDDGSYSGSEGDDDSGIDEEGHEMEHGKDRLYEYDDDDDDDSTEFNSEVGLEDLGAVMLQIGSCQFEPEGTSLSFDEDYSYTSNMFPPVVSKYMNARTNTNHHHHAVRPNQSNLESEAARNAIFQKRLQNRMRPASKSNKESGGLSTFFVSKSGSYILFANSEIELTFCSYCIRFLSLSSLSRTKHSAAAANCKLSTSAGITVSHKAHSTCQWEVSQHERLCIITKLYPF